MQWNSQRLVPQYGYREQELYLNGLIENNVKGKLLTPQQHLRCSEHTEKIFNIMGTKVILLVRNIFDTVMSLKDHCENENVVFPSGYMNQDIWDELTEHEKYEFLSKLVIPWYINFYVGWRESDYYKSGNVLIVSYEKMTTETKSEFQKICEFINEPFDESKFDKVLEGIGGKRTRKNKGVAGRGVKLDDNLKKVTRDYTKFYKGVDFSKIGLK